MKKHYILTAAIAMISAALSLESVARNYESVQGDPMHTRIYTLDNGLKVFLSVNK